ncbi:MAG: sialidase family protein [Planctomycetia bacterium]|nr:sialidase family protein [Planctomycetia bacterium]
MIFKKSACLALLCAGGLFSSAWAKEQNVAKTFEPVWLNANDLSLATGNPSLTVMSHGSVHVPIWSLSGGTVGQSVSGIVPNLPKDCAAVKIEIVVTSEDPETKSELEDVYRVHLSQMPENGPFNSGYVLGTPVRTKLPEAPFFTRTITLESWYGVDPSKPLVLRIQREPGDPANTFKRPVGLAAVKVTPLSGLEEPMIVQNVPGYNSWPVIQAIGEKLVCVYSRGTAHTIGEGIRGVWARTSEDGGRTWTEETLVANEPDVGEVTIGKGLDEDGAMLLWIRSVGKVFRHDLYRTTDGINFKHISRPNLNPMPMQITDVFSVPSVGLMALWFAGNYSEKENNHSWGTIISKDNGLTWEQHVVEQDLPKSEWPTEPSAVYLGDGKILVIARTESGGGTTGRAQFQMISNDFGATWTKNRTNIGEVSASTPSLILDPQTGLLSNYYYQRGRGILRRRVVKPEDIFNNPLAWPDSEAVALGSDITYHAGNVNAVAIGEKHFLSFYSGDEKDTAVVVSKVKAPEK